MKTKDEKPQIQTKKKHKKKKKLNAFKTLS